MLEKHILGCRLCAEKAAKIDDKVNAIQIALSRWADAKTKGSTQQIRRDCNRN